MLLRDEHFQVVGVVSQPDRARGRNLTITPSPIKSLAMQHHLAVLTPEKISLELEAIAAWKAEVAVVVAFGQILPQKFLDLFPLGAVNVHGSLLPRWRGASPIQRALQAGDVQTGVCLQKVVRELDAGDVLGERKIDLDANINARELHDQLSVLGADLLHIELMDYVRGNLAGKPQDPRFVTYAKKIEKSEAEIRWEQTAEVIHNTVRAFVMGPGTWTSWKGKKFKIHETRVASVALQLAPGEFREQQGKLYVGCGSGALEIRVLQEESRKRVSAAEFLRR